MIDQLSHVWVLLILCMNVIVVSLVFLMYHNLRNIFSEFLVFKKKVNHWETRMNQVITDVQACVVYQNTLNLKDSPFHIDDSETQRRVVESGRSSASATGNLNVIGKKKATAMVVEEDDCESVELLLQC